MKADKEEREKHDYISDQIDVVMRDLVADMWRKKPKDSLDFMLDWFKAERRGEHAKKEYPKLEKYHRFLDILDV